jgi:hypothetical protein
VELYERIRREYEHGGGTIRGIFADPLFGHLQIVSPGELDQRRRLARNRVRFALLLGRDPCLDCRHPHDRTPSHCRRRGAPEPAQEYCRPGRASSRAGDQTSSPRELEAGRALGAAQPCLLGVLRSAANARVTIAPIVSPLLLAYARRRHAVPAGSLSVIGTVTSETSTGRSRWVACSRYR